VDYIFLDHQILPREDFVRLWETYSSGKQAESALSSGKVFSDYKYYDLKRVVREGEIAKEKVITSNLRLVMAWAFKYNKVYGLEVDDHFQNGVFGLIRAIEKFDPDLGYEFSTYAVWWIRQAITRETANQAALIRKPVHVLENLRKIKRVENDLKISMEANPSIEAIADRVGLDLKKVTELMSLIDTELMSLIDIVIRFDGLLGAGLSPQGDLVLDPETDRERFELTDILDASMHVLNEREREILLKRFGFIDDTVQILETIGSDLGLTRERIRQIETGALLKLRKEISRSDAVEGYVDKKTAVKLRKEISQTETAESYIARKKAQSKPVQSTTVPPVIKYVTTELWEGSSSDVKRVKEYLSPRAHSCIEILSGSNQYTESSLGRAVGESSLRFYRWFWKELERACGVVGCESPLQINEGVIILDYQFKEFWISQDEI